MKALGNAALIIGIVSLGLGIILRLVEKQVGLGLTPSSFLEFSIACFLLAIAVEVSKK